MLAIKILLLGGLFMAFSMGLPPVSEAAAESPGSHGDQHGHYGN